MPGELINRLGGLPFARRDGKKYLWEDNCNIGGLHLGAEVVSSKEENNKDKERAVEYFVLE